MVGPRLASIDALCVEYDLQWQGRKRVARDGVADENVTDSIGKMVSV